MGIATDGNELRVSVSLYKLYSLYTAEREEEKKDSPNHRKYARTNYSSVLLAYPDLQSLSLLTGAIRWPSSFTNTAWNPVKIDVHVYPSQPLLVDGAAVGRRTDDIDVELGQQ